MPMVLLGDVRNGGGRRGIRYLCLLCHAFSKGKKSYPGLFDMDSFVSFCFICSSLCKIKPKTKENTMITFHSEHFLNVQVNVL